MMKSILAAGAAVASLALPAAAQMTNVNQLKDVQPTDWAYQAIANLVERYGCIAGYPDGTFRPERVATRSEGAALVSACLDNISTFYTEADAKLAAALRAEFAGEIAKTNTRVTKLEVAAQTKNLGVGNYLGLGVLLNRQGVDGDGKTENSVISGGTLQARYAAKTFSNLSAISVRPYLNAVAGPNNRIGAAGGATLTYDYPLAKKTLANGGKVSAANLYLGAGYQVPLTNDAQTNYQAGVGQEGQVMFVLGAEGRLTNSLVGFADVKFPTTTSANVNGNTNGTYSPVFTTGLGFKF